MKTVTLRGVCLVVLSPLFLACGPLEPDAGAAEAPVSEAAASQALDSNLPECDTLQGQSCFINMVECTWQSDGALGLCICQQTASGLRYRCYR